MIEYVLSVDQVVDALTKPFPSSSFMFLRPKLLVLPPINLRETIDTQKLVFQILYL